MIHLVPPVPRTLLVGRAIPRRKDSPSRFQVAIKVLFLSRNKFSTLTVTSNTFNMNGHQELKTSVLPVDVHNIGKVSAVSNDDDILDDIDIQLSTQTLDASNLRLAADQLKYSDIPVAFPTETVYGLGADATRSAAVKGIYKAKQRPIDNPLIVHFASLKQLRDLLKPSAHSAAPQINDHIAQSALEDPIPTIYRPIISRFWPGPLTIILPNPRNSPLAPEVTAGLNTFGARMPKHVLALALMKLADVPVAAPSANASTKPSPTAAEHVAHDLDGRIETIIDGGPCDVGVESTVVDGLSQPPFILRPGGVSIEQLRACPGWEDTQIGYENFSETESRPKAPGMKYRHYSPKATVVLYEPGKPPPSLSDLSNYVGTNTRLGVITTKQWEIQGDATSKVIEKSKLKQNDSKQSLYDDDKPDFAAMLKSLQAKPDARTSLTTRTFQGNASTFCLLEIALGSGTANIARGIFSALRELDRQEVDAIFVEGIDELEGDTAAAVMNRLRKATEVTVGS